MQKISTLEKAMIIWLTFYTSITTFLYLVSPFRKVVSFPFSLCVVSVLLLPVIVFLFLLLQDNLYPNKPITNTPVSVGLPGLQNDDTAILYESQRQQQFETA